MPRQKIRDVKRNETPYVRCPNPENYGFPLRKLLSKFLSFLFLKEWTWKNLEQVIDLVN